MTGITHDPIYLSTSVDKATADHYQIPGVRRPHTLPFHPQNVLPIATLVVEATRQQVRRGKKDRHRYTVRPTTTRILYLNSCSTHDALSGTRPRRMQPRDSSCDDGSEDLRTSGMCNLRHPEVLVSTGGRSSLLGTFRWPSCLWQ